jgi:hypothetical protein
MKKFLIASAALAAAFGSFAAAPASANPHGYGHDRGYGYERGDRPNVSEREIARRIEMGERTGQLTRREAWRLRSELRNINRLEAEYRWDGLNWRERADLDRRLDFLSRQVRYERHDGDRAYRDYGSRDYGNRNW